MAEGFSKRAMKTAKAAPKPLQKRRRGRTTRPFRGVVQKLMRANHPTLTISSAALAAVADILHSFMHRVGGQMIVAKGVSRRKTMTLSEMKVAVATELGVSRNEIKENRLEVHAFNAGLKAVMNYATSDEPQA